MSQGAAHAVNVNLVATFDGTNGASPWATLIQAKDDRYYGTTSDGGSGGVGTIFSVTPAGSLKTVATFYGTNGARPHNGLVQDRDGTFYGTTTEGGAYNLGTVFRLDGETIATLISFDGTNGSTPKAELIAGPGGDFYGTTYKGGSEDLGTIFRMTTNGVLTTLVTFGKTNGASPFGGLIRGADGNFYGTTEASPYVNPVSGDVSQLGGRGSVFRMTPEGVLTTLATFDDAAGLEPRGPLVQSLNGDLYGVTSSGGDAGLGTVFKLSSGGTLSTLLEFSQTNGALPVGGLIRGPDGYFYGVTEGGTVNTNDPYGAGTIFRVAPNGTATTVVILDYTKGYYPLGGLVLGRDGALYGTTLLGPLANWGTVIQITDYAGPPLAGFFHEVSGDYAGLFCESNSVRHESSGYLSAAVTDSGRFTARLIIGGKTFRLNDRFDSLGLVTKTVNRGMQEPLTVRLRLDLSGGSDQMTGTISNSQWIADLLADRAIFDAATNPSPCTGSYTLDIQGDPFGDDNIPFGDGVATVSVLPSGQLRLRGWLGDNTAIAQKTFVSKKGTWPLYVSLYGGKGSILAWVNFTPDESDDLSADLHWTRPAMPGKRFYPDGFDFNTQLIGSAYVAPTNNTTRILDLEHGWMMFSSNEAFAGFANELYLGDDNRVNNVSNNRLNLSFNLVDGSFGGNVIDPMTGNAIRYRGVVLQKQVFGFGNFPGLHQTGYVELQPLP